MINPNIELDPQVIRFARRSFLVALDNSDRSTGVKALLDVAGLVSGAKIPDCGDYDTHELGGAVRGVLRAKGDGEIMIDGPQYAQSSYILQRYISALLPTADMLTISADIDPQVLRNMAEFLGKIANRTRVYVAGASPEMGKASQSSKRAIELCLMFGFAGAMFRAVDLPALTRHFGDSISELDLVCTGVSTESKPGRVYPNVAFHGGAKRVVLGRSLRECPDAMSYMVALCQSLDEDLFAEHRIGSDKDTNI